ncbi:MAG: hypothetical protein U0441_13385 [Polyangiaceae bacterium]
MRRVLGWWRLAVFSGVVTVGMGGVERTASAGEPQSAPGGAKSAGATPGDGATGGVAGAQNKATAEDLYQQGMTLLKQSKWAEAAAKLEESNRIDPAPGTTVNLADCYEHMGRLASAWTLFVDAATVFGRRTPPDPRGDKAKARAEALYPRLARLTLEVPESVRAVAGLVVKRDGVEVGGAQLGTGIAVDPGTHAIEVTAPGKKAWTKDVKVEGDAAKVTVTLGPLEDAPKGEGVGGGSGGVAGGGGGTPGSAGASGGNGGAPSGNGEWPWQKKAAIGVGAVGVAGLVAGAVTGGLAMGKAGDLSKECSASDPHLCTANGVTLASDAKTMAMVSTIGFAAGGALAAAGIVLWIVAPSDRAQSGTNVKGKEANGDAQTRPTSTARDSGPRVWLAPEVGVRTGATVGVSW